MTSDPILDSKDDSVFEITTKSHGPEGTIPFDADTLSRSPSGNIFGWIQNAGMGCSNGGLTKKDFLILSTRGGLTTPEGSVAALGFHSGHWELDKLMQAAAWEIRHAGALPFAAYCTDPCDGRTQGTAGMMDSLPYRNNASVLFQRLIRSLPTCKGVLGVATCDKGLPAMMMALAASKELPSVIIPGGVTLPAVEGEDLGTIQSIGARFAVGEVSLDYARNVSCRACASPGGGCQFLGTAATSQVVTEALGMTVPHAALSPSGQPIWLDMARRSARALLRMENRQLLMKNILTDASVKNAMTVFAAFGGSTNMLLHLPAVAFAAGLQRPAVEDWIEINVRTPRLVDVLPNGPVGHPTIRVFLAGGVQEVMLHLRTLNLLNLDTMTASGYRLGVILDWWEKSERRKRLRSILHEKDDIDPGDVIMSPDKARQKGLMGTITFPRGNLAPDGAVIKSTAIDKSLLDADGKYHLVGPAKVFLTESHAIEAIKTEKVKPGDVMVLICMGPMGSGMGEIYQVTAALKHISWGKHIALISDARFSGVSTGPCIGHIGPEALAGGPIGKIIDGDIIQIDIDCRNLMGRVNLIGAAETNKDLQSIETGNSLLANRTARNDLQAQKGLPDDTRLWALLQDISGGTWAGCCFDIEKIISAMK